MHDEILRALAEGGAYDPEAMAARVGLSGPLVEQLLDELQNHGYVERLNRAVPGRCMGCALRGSCDMGCALRGWTLTAEGASLLLSVSSARGGADATAIPPTR